MDRPVEQHGLELRADRDRPILEFAVAALLGAVAATLGFLAAEATRPRHVDC